MKRILVVLAFLLVLPGTVAFAETRSLEFRDFSEISVGYGMRVSLRQDNAFRVEATGDSTDLGRLKVKQDGDRLDFSLQSNWLRGIRAGQISLDITLPTLRKLNLSGGARGNLDQFTVDRLEASVSGGSEVAGRLNAGDMDLSISGGSRIVLSGSGKQLRLSMSGGSRFEAKDLAATDVRANLSGGSWAAVNMNGELDARLSGGSHVTYYGNAALGSIAASGGSRVRKGT